MSDRIQSKRTSWLVQDESALDAELMEQWERKEGSTWWSNGWWIVLTPLSLWLWWELLVLLATLLKWIVGA